MSGGQSHVPLIHCRFCFESQGLFVQSSPGLAGFTQTPFLSLN